MDRLKDVFTSLKQNNDDDSVDRLNYYYTVILMLGFAITVLYNEAVGEPLQCWVPAEFTKHWEQYAENYCFVENTYWVPMNDSLPDDFETRDEMKITYYQWVPFVLALQAFLFYIPHLIWQSMNWQSGINVPVIASMASDSTNIFDSNRNKAVTTIVKNIQDAGTVQKSLDKSQNLFNCLMVFGKTKGYYINSLYIVCKLLYIVNLIGQFAIINSFIGSRYTFWGASIIVDLVQGRTWEESGHFPRVTMCDFDIRSLGTIRHFSVQCVLMINMFIEKIYIFIWWWLLGVAIVTILNTMWWIRVSVLESAQYNFVHQYMLGSNENQPDAAPVEIAKFRKFINSGLRADGVFMLRLVSSNAGDVVTAQIVSRLWTEYNKRPSWSALPEILTLIDKQKEAKLNEKNFLSKFE